VSGESLYVYSFLGHQAFSSDRTESSLGMEWNVHLKCMRLIRNGKPCSKKGKSATTLVDKAGGIGRNVSTTSSSATLWIWNRILLL
jgi:hypothetical protein